MIEKCGIANRPLQDSSNEKKIYMAKISSFCNERKLIMPMHKMLISIKIVTVGSHYLQQPVYALLTLDSVF